MRGTGLGASRACWWHEDGYVMIQSVQRKPSLLGQQARCWELNVPAQRGHGVHTPTPGIWLAAVTHAASSKRTLLSPAWAEEKHPVCS